jgi:WD40-like Beta Propeller Repeat
LGARLRTALVGACFVALLLAAPSAHAAFPGPNGRIAISENLTGTQEFPQYEVYSVNPDGSDFRQVTATNTGCNFDPAWSPDSSKLAVTNGGCPVGGPPRQIYTVNADGTGMSPLTSGATSAHSPAWSPDGTKVAFSRSDGIYLINANGTGETRLTSDSFDADAVWSPDGTKIAFDRGSFPNDGVYVMNPDGTGQTLLSASAIGPTWSPDASRIAFVQHSNGQIYSLAPDGTNRTQMTNDSPVNFQWPVWSPDGNRFAVQRYDSANDAYPIVTMNLDGTGVFAINYDNNIPRAFDWGAAKGYPRPKGATPLQTSLVPAYKPCTAPDRTHGPPLASGSCSLPQQASTYLTVGTPDSNGLAPSSRGNVRYTTVVGNPSTPANEADVKIDVDIVGVLNKVILTSYSGELRADVGVRITDKNNTPNPSTSTATVQDTSFPVTVTCASGSCSVATTANAVTPGAVLEGKRAIWELGQVKVYDGGADGVASTTGDNTLFMDQGVFIP